MTDEKIFARWFVSPNWGDALNPFLIEHLTGKQPVWCDYPWYIKKLNSIYAKWEWLEKRQDLLNPISMGLLEFKNWLSPKRNSTDVYLVVGSILHQTDSSAVVWGAGFISENSRLREKPKKICAVRGPLSREIILKQGLECPEIYGDPALLYPRFYSPSAKKKYKLGIVPHFADQNSHLLDQFINIEEVLIIDVNGGISKFIDDIYSCEKIASSSLHGLIAADAYAIPSTWIRFSDKVIGRGFKFRDYFASVGRNVTNPLTISEKTTLRDLFSSFVEYDINIDLDRLISVCPFRIIPTDCAH